MIRKVKSSDAARVAVLMKQLGYSCSVSEMEKRLEIVAEKKRFHGYVFTEEEKILGVVIAHRYFSFLVGHEVLRIQVLVIDKQHQRMGAGRELLEKLEETAGKWGCESLEATCKVRRAIAHRFYVSCGFEKTSFKFVKKLKKAQAKSRNGAKKGTVKPKSKKTLSEMPF